MPRMRFALALDLTLALNLALPLSLALPLAALTAQATGQSAPRPLGEIAIQGKVLDAAGKPVAGAVVRLAQLATPGLEAPKETVSNATGVFAFSAVQAGSYTLTAEKAGLRSRAASINASAPASEEHVDLSLEPSPVAGGQAAAPIADSSPPMEFADKPDFTVAGVTDWTAVGGHGSDAILRTSEALTRDTIALERDDALPGAPGAATSIGGAAESEDVLRRALRNAPASLEANRNLGEFYLRRGRYAEAAAPLEACLKLAPANPSVEYELALALKGAGDLPQAQRHIRNLLAQAPSAQAHRLAGEVDEDLGDPLSAVHELELAARIDPSEQNYFEWGSELLLHRAVWQAQEVFRKGAQAYPKSARMLAALSAALFAGALYDEAAQRVCEASGLHPADPSPYMLMGKIELAAPRPLPCIEQALGRFVHDRPNNSLGNYFYAMALLKRLDRPGEEIARQGSRLDSQRAESLLAKAVALDPKCAGAYLELGILQSSRRNSAKAMEFYRRAIEANPDLADAHYRLAVAYDRLGDAEKAKQEFALHDEIEKRQAAAIEERRRQLKQFLVVFDKEPASHAEN